MCDSKPALARLVVVKTTSGPSLLKILACNKYSFYGYLSAGVEKHSRVTKSKTF